MGIVPTYRGRGLGARLINATLKAAFGAGFVRIELDVQADNERAIALYERVSFVREGIIRDAVFADGAYGDANTMPLIRRGAAFAWVIGNLQCLT
jgi:RimJ/RimL family protein N-acetyltransferase